MKFIFSFLIGLFGFSNLFAQELIVDSGVVLKKGVYRTFEEFKYNNPSLPYNGVLYSAYKKHGFFFNGKIKYYGIGYNLEGGVKSTKVFGFCDGEKIYVRKNQFLFSLNNFVELQNFGRYSYYEKVKLNLFYIIITGFPSIPIVRTKVEYVIDINDGVSYKVKKSNLKELFSGDTNIVADFESTKRGASIKGDVIKKYSELYRYEIDYSSYLEITDIDKLIYRLPIDTTIEQYSKRIQSYSANSIFKAIKILDKSFKDGTPKYFGIWAKHDMGNNSDYYYDIGTWYYFHKNGQLKQEVNYNVIGQKHGAYIEYDDKGKVIKESMYSNGELVKE